MPWAAGDPHLLHGSGVRRRRRRQLDHAGFQGAYLLDLHHVARHPRRPKFNWHRVISQVRSIAHSLLVNGAFYDSARHRFLRVRNAVARTGHLQLTTNFSPEVADEVMLCSRCYLRGRRRRESNPRVAVSRGLRRSNGRNSADFISDALPRALNFSGGVDGSRYKVMGCVEAGTYQYTTALGGLATVRAFASNHLILLSRDR
jgi:hypothetical protein